MMIAAPAARGFFSSRKGSVLYHYVYTYAHDPAALDHYAFYAHDPATFMCCVSCPSCESAGVMSDVSCAGAIRVTRCQERTSRGAIYKSGALLCTMGGCMSRPTALFSAVEKGDVTLAASLLEKGAKKDLETKCGFFRTTPLNSAAYSLNVAMAKLLIDAGADVNARMDFELRTCVLHVMVCDHELNNCASSSDRGEPEALKKFDEILQMMLKAGLDVNAASMDFYKDKPEKRTCTDEIAWSMNETPLARAAYKRNPAVVKALLDAGADLTIACASGETPLERAVAKDLDDPDKVFDREAEAQVLALLHGETPAVV